jgi:hypothetical protein
MSHSDGTPMSYEGSIYTKMNDHKWGHLTSRRVRYGDSMIWDGWRNYVDALCYYFDYSGNYSQPCASPTCQCSCHEASLPEGLI